MSTKQINIFCAGFIINVILSSFLVYSADNSKVTLPNPSKYYKNIDDNHTISQREFDENAICGMPLWLAQIAKLGSLKADYQLIENKPSQDKVGNIETFNVVDIAGDTNEIVARAEKKGKHAYIYVDITQNFKAEKLDEILLLFDDLIYPTCREVFGSEPNPGIDGDSLITILFLPIKQPENAAGDIAGYYWPGNQFLQSNVTKNNQREIIYIDINRLNRFGVEDVSGTIAHQFQHLIHWNYDRDEEYWINEGLSEYARFISGFRFANPPALFLNNPDISLLNWTNHPADYARSFLWIMYLEEQYGGNGIVRSIVANPNPGMSALQAVLSAINPGLKVKEVFSNWIVANYIDYTSDKISLYGYKSIDLPPVKPTQTFGYLPIDCRDASVKPYAADYYLFNGGRNLIINIDGYNEAHDFSAKAIKIKPNSLPAIFDFPLDNNNDGKLPLLDFGVNFTQLLLIPYYIPEQSFNSFADYQFEAEGSGGPFVFTDTVQYFDPDSKTIIALGMPSPPINAEHFDSYAVRITPPSDGILTVAEFSVMPPAVRDVSVRFFVFNDSKDSLRVPVSKIDSVEIQIRNDSQRTITWQKVDFSNKNIHVKKGQDFHLAWEFFNIVFGDTVFAILDTAKVLTNRSSVFIKERQTWEHFASGFNFCLKTIFTIPADPTVPKITARILPVPGISLAFDVYTICENRLAPESVEGIFVWADSSEIFNFHATDDSNKFYIKENLQLPGTGSAQLIVSARHAFGTIIGTDTLNLNINLIEAKDGGKITSSDNKFILNLPSDAVKQNIYFITTQMHTETLIKENAALVENNFIFTGLEYTVGPPEVSFEKMVELTFIYKDNEIALLSENDLAIAYLENNQWEVLGGELYRDEKSISVLVNSTGSYSLVVKQFDETDVESEVNLPDIYYLQQNYPNPFNSITSIKFGLPNSTHTTLRIINLKGQIIAILLDKPLNAGEHIMEWDGTDDKKLPVASGVYLYQIQADEFIETKKLVLVK